MTDTTVHAAAMQAPAGGAYASTVGDFVDLLKPRVMSLVVFTAIAGMVVAPGSLHPVLAVVEVLCIAVGAGGSGCINMWYERDIDAIMACTSLRPIPSGRVLPDEALAFGVVLSLGPVAVMGLAVNWVAAALLALTNAFYVFVYTIWLKRRTPQNIVIGGAAGAFPPLIGWAAVTGDIGLPSIILFALIFLWTPSHFWALALFSNEDYARAGVPMLPVVGGVAETKRQMLAYTLVLFPVALAPYFVGIAGPVYLAGAVVLGALFVVSALRVLTGAGTRPAKQMFAFSILYLFLLFALLIAEPLEGVAR